MASRLETLLAIGDKLFSKRGPLMSTWQELGDHFYPERAEFTRTFTEGVTFADWLFDSSPALFRRDLGNNLSAFLRPAGSPWFMVRTGDETIDNKIENRKWLDFASGVLRREYYYAKSGTVEATRQCDHDFVTFGNGVLSSRVRAETGRSITRNHHLKDVVWLANDDGEIDHVQHKRKFAGRDIARRWPKTIPPNIKTANDRDSTIEYDVRQITCSANEYYEDTGRRGKKRAPFIELYVEITTKTVLEETPKAEFEYVIPRWHTLSGSQYAVSPAALVALPDARMLQSMKRVILEAGEKAVDPPTIATEDAILGGINIQAGGTTWVDADHDEAKSGAALRALELGKNPLLGVQLVQDVRAALADAWFINKLNLPSDKEMTAFEAGQRIKQYAREAMPVFEPFGPGYSSLLLDLKFRQMQRTGRLGRPEDIPKDLRGEDIGFDYVTPVEESEGRAKVYAFGEVANIVKAGVEINPKSARIVNLETAERDAINGTGAPATWLVDEKELAAQDAQPQAPGPGDLNSMAELVKSGAGATQAVANAAIASKKAAGVTL